MTPAFFASVPPYLNPSRLVGKQDALRFGRSSQTLGFHTFAVEPSMLPILFTLFDPLPKDADSGPDNLGKADPSSQLNLSYEPPVGGSQADSRRFGSFTHPGTSPEPHEAVATVCRGEADEIPPSQNVENSDDLVGQDVAVQSEAKALPLEWLLAPKQRITLQERLLARIVQLEARANKEHDHEWAGDCRMAFINLSKIFRGEFADYRTANVDTCYQIYGTHPAKLAGKIKRTRQCKLGKEYSLWYDDAGNLKPDLPKKPSIPSPTDRAEQFTNERLAALINFPKKEA